MRAKEKTFHSHTIMTSKLKEVKMTEAVTITAIICATILCLKILSMFKKDK